MKSKNGVCQVRPVIFYKAVYHVSSFGLFQRLLLHLSLVLEALNLALDSLKLRNFGITA